MFRGCFVALVTPFRDGSIDFGALDGLVESIIAGGVHGLVPCGTTGESPTLSTEEQLAVISAVAKRAKGRVPVIAGTGSNCTSKTLAHSQAAIKAGADAVMLVTPYYNKPNQTGLYQHFSHVAQRIDVPVMLYNIPGRCGVEISVDTIVKLRSDNPNIVAVKHATGVVETACDLMQRCDITVLSGDDPLTLPLMSVGAVGVVSVVGNLLPFEMSSFVNAALAGDWETARTWNERLFPVSREMLTLDTNPIPIKTALAMQGRMNEEFRLPMCSMDSTKKTRLKTLLSEIATMQSRQIA